MLQVVGTVALTMACMLSFAGCGKNAGTSVTGAVTWNGHAVEKGFVTFYPASGAETTRGAEIIDGQFYIAKLTPGSWRAVVTIHPEIDLGKGYEGEVLQLKAGEEARHHANGWQQSHR